VRGASEAVECGVVIANYGRALRVEAPDGVERTCVARRQATGAVCGDRVRWQAREDGSGIVVEVLPRSSLLARPDARGVMRPVCANIDQIIVVGSAQSLLLPTTGERARIDAFLAAAELLGIEACLVVNKADLVAPGARADLVAGQDAWRAAGYAVLHTSTRTGDGMEALRMRLRGRCSVFVGESGVGKSSLAQVLLPGREIRIGEVSAASGKGRHTTTVSLLFHLPDEGGDVIDSPGVREFRLGTVSPMELASAFREFRAHLGDCRYRDCRHADEPDCAIAAAAQAGRIPRQRLESYRALLQAMTAGPRGTGRATR